jgi:hypothetical protein
MTTSALTARAMTTKTTAMMNAVVYESIRPPSLALRESLRVRASCAPVRALIERFQAAPGGRRRRHLEDLGRRGSRHG